MTDGHHMQHGPMTRGQILDYEFDEFIQANPHIYKKFRMLAVKLKAKGIDRWGAKSLWEVLRWDLAMETNAPNRWSSAEQQPCQPYGPQAYVRRARRLRGLFSAAPT